MNDFFISYAKSDRGWAEWILFQLEQELYSCVVQLRDFRPSQDFVSLMRKALDQSRTIIAILSPDYFESKYAQKEMQAAFASEMLLPVRVRDCSMPKLYRSLIFIDLVGKNPRLARKELIEGIKTRPKFPGDFNDKKKATSHLVCCLRHLKRIS